MREILFRGKSKGINRGEWIYGSFVEDTNLNACCIRDKSLVYELVDRETVGQYTGLIDKNANKIFVGKFIDQNNDDEYLGFYIEFDSFRTTITQLEMKEAKDRFEIIGNIYDNPELLEVEE